MPKIGGGGSFLRGPIMRILVCWGLYGGLNFRKPPYTQSGGDASEHDLG